LTLQGGGAQLPPIGPIACGDRHSVAVTTAGEVFTWGFGGYGRLGHSDQSDKLRPALVAFSHKVQACAGARARARALADCSCVQRV
jgi:alpha-tubulin suppressor-like RCC1 family protein